MKNQITSPQTDHDAPVALQISSAHMQTTYSNFARGVMTEEEIFLDFGLNPNAAGKVLEEPAVLSNRIVLSIPSAVRLHQLLQSMLIRRQQAVEKSRKTNAPEEENPSSKS